MLSRLDDALILAQTCLDFDPYNGPWPASSNNWRK